MKTFFKFIIIAFAFSIPIFLIHFEGVFSAIIYQFFVGVLGYVWLIQKVKGVRSTVKKRSIYSFLMIILFTIAIYLTVVLYALANVLENEMI